MMGSPRPRKMSRSVSSSLSWILLLLLSVWTEANTKTNHIPMDDINYFYKTGQAPEGSDLKWPELRTATLLIDVTPLERVLDSAETTLFEASISSFFQQIFDSQSEYNLVVRSVEVAQQSVGNRQLSLETVTMAHFRPNPDDQELTDHNFHQICYHLVNKFETDLREFLREEHHSFATVETVKARSSSIANEEKTGSKQLSTSMLTYIVLAVGMAVLFLTSYATYRLYR